MEKGEFHGTGLIICQCYDGQEIKNVPIERSSSNKIRFQEDRFSYIYKCYPPKLPDINFEKTEVAKGDAMNTFIKSDLIWAIRKLFDDSENPIIPTWSAYNSLITHPLPKTIYCGLPLLRGSPTDWSNLYTSLKIVQNINEVVSPETITIVSCDLQLYNKCLQLKSNDAIRDNFVFRMGELHCVFAILKVMGKYIENSGLDLLLVESDIYGPVTLYQILGGKHMKRAIEAHTVIYMSLLHFFVKHAEDVKEDLHDLLQNIFDPAEELLNHDDVSKAFDDSCIPDFLKRLDQSFEMQSRFYLNYMVMFEHLLLFIRATRQGLWELHLESLNYFAALFFAHDQINYARLTPVYLSEMLYLKENDPETCDFFRDGNFCVNKNDVPFCAIGVDHAMEQENKRIKVKSGVIGLTQNYLEFVTIFI